MTDPVVSTHAAFDEATGELLFLAPEALIPEGMGSVALPEGYADWSHQWDTTERAFVADLEAIRTDLCAQVKALRDYHKAKGVAVSGVGSVQTDLASRVDIMEASQRASREGALFSITWTMADDTEETLDEATMIAVADAVQIHMDACQARKQSLDDLIDAASDVAALEAIDIEADWPV